MKKIWIGRVISALPVLILLFSASMKLTKNADYIKNMINAGVPETLVPTLLILQLLSTILYVIPKTAYIGAVLITGYMGGAIFTHLRIGEPVVLQTLLPIFAWLGLYLRDERLTKLMPIN
ncbi:DoxX family protein [Peredibacter starrii]|uniref:DoxX family protein n=1 Tax=Peredibacter starrii TaxID=28202 RepID=A0AAX4HSX8_9BACT|nr:DoxX family protein [Peredibacter starrii]WPU66508.1 DoxX family protein [Peredibacter starrii]